MEVDSFKYISRLVARYYKLAQVERQDPIPWTPLKQPLAESCFGLVTSGGLYHKGHEPPFDLEREQREPAWGDPSFRTLPAAISQDEVGVSHWHVNATDILADMNILLPIQRFQELVASGRLGSLAGQAYSFMGYQGFPGNLSGWREVYGPQVAAELQAQGVDCILLTTA